jgi:DNA-binding transcriptional LysR family regulator
MEWDDLRYVLAIARDHTLSSAAQRLGVSHTTVGRRLKAIEESLGVRLFDRTPDGLVPTPAGQDIAEVAEEVEANVLTLEARVLGQDEQLSGSLRVSTMDTIFNRFHEAFSSFTTRYPSVELTVMAGDREVSLTRREADVVLRMTTSPPEYLVGKKLRDVPFGVYASKELAQKIGEDAPLLAYPWLGWDERLGYRWFDAWIAHNAPGAKISVRVDFSAMHLRESIAAGLGVNFLARFDGDADPRLVRVADVSEMFTRELWLLTLPALRNTSRVRAFMDHMSEQLTSR